MNFGDTFRHYLMKFPVQIYCDSISQILFAEEHSDDLIRQFFFRLNFRNLPRNHENGAPRVSRKRDLAEAAVTCLAIVNGGVSSTKWP